jgi:hypothetical protein
MSKTYSWGSTAATSLIHPEVVIQPNIPFEDWLDIVDKEYDDTPRGHEDTPRGHEVIEGDDVNGDGTIIILK